MADPYLFTSESVAEGHPDKIADRIADAILDRHLAGDPGSRVAAEALITDNFLVLAGEIASQSSVDYEQVAKEVIRSIGYGDKNNGFDLENAEIITRIHEQSPDIARGVTGQEIGAGDQGVMFGYAVNETPHLMPLTLELAHRLTDGLKALRKSTPWLRPDGKAQVTALYDEKSKPVEVKTVLLSAQHDENVNSETVRKTLEPMIREKIGESWLSKDVKILINPTGRFVKGSPAADTGLTGRKLIVDTYGGRAHHGGGAMSGKDGTKVDRSGAYAARYIAKHIVAAGITPECEVMLAYAIGVAEPISLKINTFGYYDGEKKLAEKVLETFPVKPGAIIEAFGLRKPIFEKTATGGHFGREGFPWENLDRLGEL